MVESAFFQDLAMLMFVAGAVAILFSRLGWPKVLGYILVGIVMGEHTWGGSFLADAASAKIIGQLGVVFLMFGMGLSFSSRDMKKMRAVALPAATVDVLVMIWLGYTLGVRVFGWSPVQSLFLGVAICDSATTLLAKVIGEMGWGRRAFAKYVLGTSVCEDIICVGAIAVATGFAQGGGMSAGTLARSIGLLFVFFLTVIVFGFVLVPRLLKSVAKRKDDEALVLAVLGVCFFVSYFAYKFNYSLALGAFLVGLLGASSEVKGRLEVLVDPLKSMFSAIFFVSIGLMVNPQALWTFLPQILLVSAVVIVGKLLNNFVMALLTGLDVKTAIQHGFSLAQIGEFAFMVAILYEGIVGDAENPMFQIAVGASLLTTLTNPAMVRLSDSVGDLAVRCTSERVKGWLATYHTWLEKIHSSADVPAYRLLKASATKLGIYAVLMLSVSVACSLLHTFDYSRFSEFFERHDRIFFFLIANFFSVSLLPMIVFSARALGDEVIELLVGDGADRWRLAMRPLGCFVVQAAVLLLFLIEWSMLNITILPIDVKVEGFSIAFVLGVGVVCWRFFVKAGRRATQRFQEALTIDERAEGFIRMTTITVPEGEIQRIKLSSGSPAVGKTVVSLDIRAKTGASIVSAYRDGALKRNIGPDWTFAAGDILVALGDPPQIAALRCLLKEKP